jgi:hypothetical protein
LFPFIKKALICKVHIAIFSIWLFDWTKFVKSILPNGKIHIVQSSSPFCQMAKSTLSSCQVHFAKWQNPHCPIVKSILPNGKIHIAQLSSPWLSIPHSQSCQLLSSFKEPSSQKEAERQREGGWWVSLGSMWKKKKIEGQSEFWTKVWADQIKTKALVQNFLIRGQLEAHLGSPQGEVDLAMWQSCLGDVELVTRECWVGNVNVAIWQSGLGILIKSTWQISQIEKFGIG